MKSTMRAPILTVAVVGMLWCGALLAHPFWGTFWLFGGASGDSGRDINRPGTNLVWVDLFWGATPPHPFWRVCYAPERMNLNDTCTHRWQLTHWTSMQLTHLDADTVYRYEIFGWNSERARWERHQRSCVYAHFSRWSANEDGVMTQSPTDIGSCRRLRRFHPNAG